jgi:hypothetical protein
MIQPIRRIVGGVVVLFSVLPLWVALGFLRLEMETWFGHPYYLGNDHFARGCFWLLIGLAALVPGSYCAVSRHASAWWLGLAFAAAVFAGVVLPSNVLPTMLVPRAEDSLTAKARNVAAALDALGANQGRFPANERELANLVASAGGPNSLVGPYYRDGVVAPIRLVYIGGASGPILNEIPNPPMPAAIYCAVSADTKRFWITARMLNGAVGGQPRWLRATGTDTQPLVISGAVNDGLPRMSNMRGVNSRR